MRGVARRRRVPVPRVVHVAPARPLPRARRARRRHSGGDQARVPPPHQGDAPGRESREGRRGDVPPRQRRLRDPRRHRATRTLRPRLRFPSHGRRLRARGGDHTQSGSRRVERPVEKQKHRRKRSCARWTRGGRPRRRGRGDETKGSSSGVGGEGDAWCRAWVAALLVGVPAAAGYWLVYGVAAESIRGRILHG